MHEPTPVPNAHNPQDWQRAVIRVLGALDRICQDNGISYSLCFGGLLGAARHRGFIPWDNDVDVVMFEDDYLRLQAMALQGTLPTGYTLVDRATEKDYPLLFGRFVDTRTSCPLSTSSFNGGTHGIFVDVFVLYPLNDDPELRQRQITDFLVWEELACWLKRRSSLRTPAFIERWKEIKAYEAVHGRSAALDKIEGDFRALMPEDGEWCLHSSGGAYNGFPTFKTEWFRNTVYAPFEDIELAVPVETGKTLQRFYGGSWRLFPQGESFSAYSGASITIPGSVITEDYMQLIDADEAETTLRERKNLLMEETMLRCKSNVDLWHAEAELAALVFERGNAEAIAALGAQGPVGPARFAAPDAREHSLPFLDLSAQALALQKRAHFSEGHIAVPLEADFLTSALWVYFLNEPDYWTVQKTIERQREDAIGGTLDNRPALCALERALEAAACLYLAHDECDSEGLSCANAILEDLCPSGRQTRIGHTLRALETARTGDSEDAAKALTLAQEALREFPDDDYLQFARAAALVYCGKSEEAQRAFGDFSETSCNGMLLFEAQEVCEYAGIPFKSRALVDDKGRNIDPARPPVPRAQPDRGIGARLSTVRDFLREGVKGVSIAHRHLGLETKSASDRAKKVTERIKPLEESYQGYRSLRRLSDRRFNSWERVYPRKQAICAAAEAGDTALVRKLAKPYLDALYRVFDKDGNGLFIDRDIADACREVIEQDRSADFLCAYEERIPCAHREDIADLLRRKDVAHPYLSQR